MTYPIVHLRDIAPPARYTSSWERIKYGKIHLCTELLAEMLGTFIYVYAGVGSTASFVVGNITSQPTGSIFTVGAAYSIGVMLAVVICTAASAGHFNPCVTISFVIFKGFSLRRAFFYILAHILGAYIACLLIYAQWKDMIMVAESVLVEKGLYDKVMFSPSGPAGIFGLYVPSGANLHRVFLNEFTTDFVIGLTICACLDPTNHMIPPAAAPWVIGFAYGIAIWGYSPTSLAANTARDIGGRLTALTVWGTKATGGPYGAISALTNIPATILAFFIYETFIGSSSRTLTPQHLAFLRAHKMYLKENGLLPQGHLQALEPHGTISPSGSFDEKSMNNRVVEIAECSV